MKIKRIKHGYKMRFFSDTGIAKVQLTITKLYKSGASKFLKDDFVAHFAWKFEHLFYGPARPALRGCTAMLRTGYLKITWENAKIDTKSRGFLNNIEIL